jgi:hypothetical protein
MARTRKSIQPLNLYKYDVLIEDKGTRSDYFKISQFDGYFYGGRNAFLIAGAGVGIFRPGTKVLVEILNKNGTTVYSAPITSFIEGSSRLIQVEVYSDTPIGTGKIVILGCAQTYIDGTPIPDEWKDKFNVRWSADVIISPLIENKTPIRFAKAPSIVVDEKFYSTPSSSTFIKQINVPVDISITPKYFNVFPNGYLVKLNGPSDTRYFSPYLDGTITGSITIKNSTVSETASIFLPLTNIFNKNLAESEGSLLYTNNKTLLLEGAFSSSGQYLTNISPFGECEVTGSINIQYNQLDTVATGSSISFAKIRLIDLSTLSGEIHKIRVSYKPTTEPGEYVLLGDINTTVQELLAVDSGSRIAPTGNFRNVVINDYWYSATMSLGKKEYNPTIPIYYNSSSLVNTESFLAQCCVDLLDSINATPPIVNGNFINGVSYFIGTRNANTAVLFPRSEYTLAFNAVVTRTSESIELSQSDYSMEIYLVPEETTNGKLLETNPLGQLLGVLTPAQKFTKQNFETVEFNFKPKINESGNFGLRFVVYGGYWNIANVSLKIAQEPFFSPDEIDILIPNVNYTNKILTFKSEYLDVNNNSIGFSTLSLPTYFTGSDSLQGNAGSSISASYASTASYSPSVANVSFVMNGGSTILSTGYKGSLRIPTNVRLTGVGLFTSGSGSINVDILRQTYATYNPSITAGTSIIGTPLSMSNTAKYLDNTLTGWTTALNTDDVLNFVVSAVAGADLKIATITFNLVR